MNPSRRSDSLFLADIREAIAKILAYTAGGREAFLADGRTQDAVLRNIEVIGEAARNVSEATRKAHPAVPWREMADMRNKVIHDYFRLDVDVIWDVIQNDLPSLKLQMDSLRAQD